MEQEPLQAHRQKAKPRRNNYANYDFYRGTTGGRGAAKTLQIAALQKCRNIRPNNARPVLHTVMKRASRAVNHGPSYSLVFMKREKGYAR